MSKKCTPLWRKAHVEVKSVKNWRVRSTVGSWDVEKVHAVVVRSTFRSQKFKKMTGSEHFWTFRCRFTWQAQGIMHLVNSEQNVRHFLKRWQAWDLCRGSGKMSFAWQARYKRHVRRSGRWFPERGCILEHQIFSFGEMILLDRCSTSYDLASLFRGKRSNPFTLIRNVPP